MYVVLHQALKAMFLMFYMFVCMFLHAVLPQALKLMFWRVQIEVSSDRLVRFYYCVDTVFVDFKSADNDEIADNCTYIYFSESFFYVLE